MSSDFEWPIPPHFELVRKSSAGDSDRQPCVVVMNDLRQQPGNLVRLDPATSMLEFQADRAATNINIGFSSFKTLRLTEPVELKHLQLSLDRLLHHAVVVQIEGLDWEAYDWIAPFDDFVSGLGIPVAPGSVKHNV